MRFNIGNWKLRVLCSAVCLAVLGSLAYSAAPSRPQIKQDEKSKVTGTITGRNGDLVSLKEKHTGRVVVVSLNDDTKVERKKGKVEFFRHENMDVTAMVPGLTIEAEGVGNAKGQLVAKKVTFVPDEFAVEVAEEQQIMANKAAAGQAQTTADQGVAAAGQAQTSANQAQTSANQAGNAAEAAGDVAVMDAAAVKLVNQRVSDLDDYKTVAAAGIYFDSGKANLDDAAKADLDMVVAATQGVEGYLIEVAGYASSTGTKAENQKLSEERAAVVVQYLQIKGNVPLRRIVAPAGYGSTHPAAENTDSQGRALNRRVDVKVLLNKGTTEGL
ncbi:MAG TPA: OmpA family protein [Candidatus Acidoferrales bacterium]|jgi:outer membrane protein OmpA-like peptidoglycan-associated protein|nr:OmpA family protein [Candidatus Acidoferrales bacterium]